MRAELAGSPEAAAEILREGAEGGLPEAQALYGQILLDGRGVARDPAAALHWFRKAAHGGSPIGANMVGRCYEKGWGADVNKQLAAIWYKAAAERGSDWGMYNYGSALGLGSGVKKNDEAALAWFRKAAALGHAKSINFVGLYYEEGRFVPRDLSEAARCYKRAAEGGDFRGQFNHARMLAMSGNYEKAATWLKTASNAATHEFRLFMKTCFQDSEIPILRAAAAEL